MTNKTTMLEPVGYFACDPETLEPVWDEGCVCQDDIYNQEDFGTIGRPFIFTDQAEAYADARVREALEEAANAVADPVYIEAAIENFAWVSHGNYVRAHHILRDAVEAIRALIPDK